MVVPSKKVKLEEENKLKGNYYFDLSAEFVVPV